jgi:Flp pilus assembly pilin Flp
VTRKRSKVQLRRFLADECGATAIEYALIAVIVAVMLVPVLLVLQNSLANMPAWNRIFAAISGN